MATTEVSQKIDEFFAQYPKKVFRKGEVLIQAGESPKKITYLVSGQVSQYDISPGGDKVIVNVFKLGSFFPMSWAINKTSNEYFFEAATDSQGVLVPAEDVIGFIKNNPDVMFDLLARVYKGTDGLLRRSAHLMGGGARNRLIFELVVSARRFGEPVNGEMVIKLSESELGERTGIRRETVSRELGQLKKEGLVKLSRNQITVSSLAKLEEVLGTEL